MTVDPHTAAPRRASRPAPIISARPAAAPILWPTRKVSGKERAARRRRRGAIYTCPMHPEIRQVGPGTCPICGMALEPELVTADSGPNPELADMTRRFWIGLALALAGRRARDGRPSLDLTPASVGRCPTGSSSARHAGGAVGGVAVLRAGLASLVTRNLNMFTLIAIGTGVAWLYSAVAVLAPGLFPPAFRGHDGAVAGLFRSRRRHYRSRAARPGAGAARARGDLAARSARCSISRRTPRAAWADGGARKTSRSRPSPSATDCACARARRSRSTAP